MLFLVPAPLSDAECAANRKRAMAKVVLQSRKRKAEREVAAAQEDMTALFRRVMSEPTIMQCLLHWLDFRALVTLVAFTDRNLRLRYATHNPGKHIKIPRTRSITADDRAKIREDTVKKLAAESCAFDWPRRIREHMGLRYKTYMAPTPHVNTLRLYLNDVIGAKRMPSRTTSSFRCHYCQHNRSFIVKKNISCLVNKQLSPLNCCSTCFIERDAGFRYGWSGYFKFNCHYHVRDVVRIAMCEMILRSVRQDVHLEAAIGKMSVDCIIFVLRQEKGDIFAQWPAFELYFQPHLVQYLLHKPSSRSDRTMVVRYEDIRNVCEVAYRAIIDSLVTSFNALQASKTAGTFLTYARTSHAMRWNDHYKHYCRAHPEFHDLFVRDESAAIHVFSSLAHEVQVDVTTTTSKHRYDVHKKRKIEP